MKQSEYKRLYNIEKKERIAEYTKKYSEENKEAVAERRKKYRESNKDKIAKSSKKYREKNKELTASKAKVYRVIHKEESAKYSKIYGEKNKDSIAERNRKYLIENRDKCNIVTQRYRSRKRKLTSSFTVEQWEYIKVHFDNKCAYCGERRPLAQDHFISVAEGGEYSKDNIIPCCGSCNSSKSNRDFFTWYPLKYFYNHEREIKILNHLGYKQRKQQLSVF